MFKTGVHGPGGITSAFPMMIPSSSSSAPAPSQPIVRPVVNEVRVWFETVGDSPWELDGCRATVSFSRTVLIGDPNAWIRCKTKAHAMWERAARSHQKTRIEDPDQSHSAFVAL
jgi:hypothetical protein